MARVRASPRVKLMKTTTMTIIAAFVVCGSACGTYSGMRTANNLRQGQIELGGGFAANEIGEVLPVVRASVGVTDAVEIGGQYEVYSALASARVALRRSETHGFALAAGIEGGMVSLLKTVSNDDSDFGLRAEALGAVVAIGHRWSAVEGYILTKALAVGWAQAATSFLGTYRGGLRFGRGAVQLGVEAGGTLHHVIFVAEATGYVALVF